MAELKISPAALQDLKKIKDHISEELGNPDAAKRTIRKIVDHYTLLETMPFMGASLSSILPIPTDYRFLVCGNYIVFYKANEQFVSIYRVLYGRRDYLKLLFENELPTDKE